MHPPALLVKLMAKYGDEEEEEEEEERDDGGRETKGDIRGSICDLDIDQRRERDDLCSFVFLICF